MVGFQTNASVEPGAGAGSLVWNSGVVGWRLGGGGSFAAALSNSSRPLLERAGLAAVGDVAEAATGGLAGSGRRSGDRRVLGFAVVGGGGVALGAGGAVTVALTTVLAGAEGVTTSGAAAVADAIGGDAIGGDATGGGAAAVCVAAVVAAGGVVAEPIVLTGTWVASTGGVAVLGAEGETGGVDPAAGASATKPSAGCGGAGKFSRNMVGGASP